MRDGAQRAHNAARPQRIGNGLFQTMTFTHVKISDGTRLIAANLEGDNHKIGILQRRFPIGMAGNVTVCAR
ncbi:hypothetical protein D3C81_1990600 [compost metagenome]